MKKQLLAGAASLVMAATPVFGVFAEAPQAGTADGTFMGTHDVKVGEVDETVYSVDINWGDLTFDWKYDVENNEYNFKAHTVCQGWGVDYGDYQTGWDSEFLSYMQGEDRLYSDSSCHIKYDGELDPETPYYTLSYGSANWIQVIDSSVNGKLKAEASFASADDYSWVAGAFSSYSLVSKDGEIQYFDDLESFVTAGGGIGATADDPIISLFTYINLEKISGMGNTNPITEGDKIGTVTIDIEPDLN